MLRRLCKDVRFKEEIVLTKKEIKWLNQQHQIYFSWDFIFFFDNNIACFSMNIATVTDAFLRLMKKCFWLNSSDLLQFQREHTWKWSSNIGFTRTYLLWGAFLLNMLRVQKRFFTPSSLFFVVSCFPDVKIIFFFLFTQWYKCTAVT